MVDDKIIKMGKDTENLIVSLIIIHLLKNPMVGGNPLRDNKLIIKFNFCLIGFVVIWFKYIKLFFFNLFMIIRFINE